jgi:hypothetical protein
MKSTMKFLKQSELCFLIFLFVLNLYCAFANSGENVVDGTHLTLASIVLMMFTDKIFTEKKN